MSEIPRKPDKKDNIPCSPYLEMNHTIIEQSARHSGYNYAIDEYEKYHEYALAEQKRKILEGLPDEDKLIRVIEAEMFTARNPTLYGMVRILAKAVHSLYEKAVNLKRKGVE